MTSTEPDQTQMWETYRRRRTRRRAGAGRRRRRLRGAARPPAGAGARPRRSTSRAFRSWRSPSSISPTSRRSAASAWKLAADYLVMAAWLAYLKSRLLLPDSTTTRSRPARNCRRSWPSACGGWRRCATRRRGSPTATGSAATSSPAARRSRSRSTSKSEYSATLYDFFRPMPRSASSTRFRSCTVRRARSGRCRRRATSLARMVGRIAEWTPLDVFMSPYLVTTGDARARVTASAFGASLELVREGKLEIRQTEAFAPLYIRDRLTGRACQHRRPAMANSKRRRRDRRRQRRQRRRTQSPEDRRQGLRMVEALAVRLGRAGVGRGPRRPPAGRRRCRRAAQRAAAESTPMRGVNLVQVAGKWSFRTAGDLSFLLSREAVEQRSCRARRWRRWRSSPTTSR